jgi:hypothetical protein
MEISLSLTNIDFSLALTVLCEKIASSRAFLEMAG